MEGSNDENGPKRCQTHCLGHRYVILNIFFAYYDTEVVFYAYIGRDMDGREMEGGDNEKRAQTTCLPSFGQLGPQVCVF